MAELSIGDIARQAGVAPSTLRYYERIGLLPAPQRQSGQRRYSGDTLALIRVLQLAQQAGFSLSEMQVLVHGFSPDTPPAARWKILASQKLLELEQQVSQIRQMQGLLHSALECGCLRLEDCATLGEGLCST